MSEFNNLPKKTDNPVHCHPNSPTAPKPADGQADNAALPSAEAEVSSTVRADASDTTPVPDSAVKTASDTTPVPDSAAKTNPGTGTQSATKPSGPAAHAGGKNTEKKASDPAVSPASAAFRPSDFARELAEVNRKKFPVSCTVIFILTALSGILYFAFTKSPAFADWFNTHISFLFRRLLSFLTVWIPFSAAELLILLIPAILVYLIVVAYRKYSDSWRSAGIYIARLLSVFCVIAIIFVLNFAPGYYGATLDKKLDLNREKVSKEELYQTSLLLSKQLNQLTDSLIFPSEESSSVMPYSYRELNRKLMDAYESFTGNHDFPDHFYSRVKPVMLSEPMSYTHITGVYTFFTGEANININFPDYTIPFTAAHELAHQRGIAREDEANMIAFLVCMESDDPYIRYSALLNVYEYVSSALYSADKNLYSTVSSTLPSAVIQEERAYSKFFEKYRDNVMADISEATNDAYLQSQGAPEGTRSYNMVVDLTVAYYRPILNRTEAPAG